MIITRHTGITIMAILMSLLLLRSAHADWLAVDLTQIVPGDPTVVLTPEVPSDREPSFIVQSNTPGELKWISMPLPVTTEQIIQAIEICYQATDAGAFIRQTRLVEFLSPTHRLDDPIVHASRTATCYRSRVRGGYTPTDAVSLWVRLQFAQATDAVVIDSVRIQVKPASVTPMR
jgi:hypothetical protein